MSGVGERQTVDVAPTAESIVRDFDELVRVLEEAIELLGRDDVDIRTSLSSARAAAIRGRVLSARLLRSAD